MGCSTVTKQPENQNVVPNIHSYKQFYEAIAKGSKLVILDDDVLDIANFINQHPGGKTMLEKYCGIFNSM